MVMTLLPGALPGARWVWSALQLGHLEPHLGRGGEAGAQYLKHTTGFRPCPRHYSSGWSLEAWRELIPRSHRQYVSVKKKDCDFAYDRLLQLQKSMMMMAIALY